MSSRNREYCLVTSMKKQESPLYMGMLIIHHSSFTKVYKMMCGEQAREGAREGTTLRTPARQREREPLGPQRAMLARHTGQSVLTD